MLGGGESPSQPTAKQSYIYPDLSKVPAFPQTSDTTSTMVYVSKYKDHYCLLSTQSSKTLKNTIFRFTENCIN